MNFGGYLATSIYGYHGYLHVYGYHGYLHVLGYPTTYKWVFFPSKRLINHPFLANLHVFGSKNGVPPCPSLNFFTSSATVPLATSAGSAAVTSSSSATRGCRSSARAAQSSWRWPCDSARTPR